MNELVFLSAEEALLHLANTLGKKVIVAAKKEVKNPRKKPENKSEDQNWDNSDMWGDSKNHKYPLFDTSGTLSIKKCKSALRYLNMPKSKKSYPDNKERSRVLSKIVKAIFKLDPKAKINYQAKDPMYQVLSESIKKKMNGYSDNKKKACVENSKEAMEMKSSEDNIDLFALDNALRIAEGSVDLHDVQKKLQTLKGKVSAPFLSKKLRQIGLEEKDINSLKVGELIDRLVGFANSEEAEEVEETEEIPSEEVEIACLVAGDSKEVKKDLLELIKKSSSQKFDRSIKQVLSKAINQTKITVAELIDMLRDEIGKADEDVKEETEEESAENLQELVKESI